MIKEKDKLKIKDLLAANARGKLSQPQRGELLRLLDLYWVEDDKCDKEQINADSQTVKALMHTLWQEAIEERSTEDSTQVDWDKMYQDITQEKTKSKAQDLAMASATKDKPQLKSITLKSLYSKWAAAAAVLLIIGLGTWWMINHQSLTTPPYITSVDSLKEQELSAPSGARAVLVLSDGSELSLDSTRSGLLATEGKSTIRLSGENALSYEGQLTANGSTAFNELRVLKGSQPVSVRLSDGSKVWLNVGSTLKYPTAFNAKQRKVTLKGEGYFEVQKDKTRPFIVEDGSLSIKVIGTHFNVSSYQDDPNIKVTLLEGAVEIDKKGKTLLLKPGEQAVTTSQETQPLKLNPEPDMEQVLSWRSEDFIFGQHTDFEQIMREIARWYDVDLEFTGRVQTQFWGSLPRSASIQEILQILEATGGVKFTLKRRQLKVIPVQQ